MKRRMRIPAAAAICSTSSGVEAVVAADVSAASSGAMTGEPRVGGFERIASARSDASRRACSARPIVPLARRDWKGLTPQACHWVISWPGSPMRFKTSAWYASSGSASACSKAFRSGRTDSWTLNHEPPVFTALEAARISVRERADGRRLRRLLTAPGSKDSPRGGIEPEPSSGRVLGPADDNLFDNLPPGHARSSADDHAWSEARVEYPVEPPGPARTPPGVISPSRPVALCQPGRAGRRRRAPGSAGTDGGLLRGEGAGVESRR